MKKQIRAAALALCTLMLFATATGCGKQEKTATEQPALEAVEYSNLIDEDSRKQLSELLTDAGIEESRITALMDRVEQFNASVKSEWLTDGFESAAPTDTKYDPYEMQDEWTAANGSFPGYNCRITAFGLFSEFITAGADQPETQGEDSLFTDLETISADPDALCGGSTAKFCALFAPVNAADSTEVEAQVKALQEGWAARGIAFADSRASMISVVFHDKFSDEDNTLFIGHVGVLLPAEDGSLYFIEKVAFQEPYRLVKLQNRAELSNYLMEKYDTSWGQDTTRPFIMENDTLMDGYRPNPLEEANP
ncbi:DUF4300 family protein [Oscillibacter sp. ER4]|jgi:hypothetical protein|uniref:DUF4300 family protein n=1 Tax=Oscillibacter sp. ER4 TaxID=1519439 RepID=UPI00051B24A9|nr:DUF4300 family protein [Oscillibacter sp. ER4]